MPAGMNGGNGAGSVARPITRAATPPRSGRVWMPLLLGAAVLGPAPLAPINIVRRNERVHWRPAFTGYKAQQVDPAPLPIQRPQTAASLQHFNGRVSMPRGPNLWPPYVPPFGYGTLSPTTPVRVANAQRVHWRAAIGGASPGLSFGVQRPVSSPRRMVSGKATVPHALPVTAAATGGASLRGLQVSSARRPVPGRVIFSRFGDLPNPILKSTKAARRPNGPLSGRVWMPKGPPQAPIFPEYPFRSVQKPISSQRKLTAGRVWIPRGTAPAQSAQPPPPRAMMVALGHPWHAGRVIVPRFAPPGLRLKYTLLATPIARRRGDDRIRSHAGWCLRWLPAPLFGPAIPALGYNIYSNAGSGPINYNTPIATVYGLTWTSGPLAFPDAWMFGVRAFNGNGEEQNLEASVTIILNGCGQDITNQPLPPFGLRAFATACGGIRAEWTYNTLNPTVVPTGFHVYIGDNLAAVLYPVSPISRAGRHGRAWRSGSARWRGAVGSGINYATSVATVSFQAAIAGTFVANIPGLSNGVTYTIGVRAYNAIAEDPNTSTVTVTADSVGPTAIVSLTAVATA